MREYRGRGMARRGSCATLRTMRTSQDHSHRRYAAGLAAFGMLALAACGASGSSYSSSAGTAAPNTPATRSSAVVSIAAGTKLGSVLGDAGARTLYTLTRNGAPVPCAGPCAAVWPPLTLPAGATATAAPGIAGIGTTVSGGREQVTEMNQPLYRFSGDTKPGDTNGDGISSFGGEWRAVRSTGVAPNTAPSATSGGSSGGYGN